MILTLDVGTTSMKLCLFDHALQIHAQTSVEYALQTNGCFVEADASVYTDCLRQGLHQLGDCRNVEAICITTQGETMIPVDADGTALCKAIVWLDSRAEQQAEQLAQTLDRQAFYQATGLPELTGALPLCKLMWFRQMQPEIYRRTFKFLLLEDYLLLRLTGQFVTEKSLLTSTGYFHLASDDYWYEILSAADIDTQKLPTALECGTLAGYLLQKPAEIFALPAGIPVFTGAMDQIAAAFAAGCTQAGHLCETTGTALVAAAFTDAPHFSNTHHLTIYRHIQAGTFLYLPISNTGGMSLKWLRDLFFSDLSGHPDGGYAALDALAQQSSPGAGGLVFLPFLAGAVDPLTLPQATGCFFGARLSTTRADFVRAVLEAVCFQLRDFLTMLHSLGCQATHICSLGGGANSTLWMQMKSDICRMDFSTLHTAQAASLGAAMLACRVMKIPAAHINSEKTVYSPNEATVSAYETKYRTYQQLLSALLPLYQQSKEE